MERSGFSDRTNYRNIQEPVSAERISSPDLFPVLFSPSFLPPFLYFPPISSYDPSGVTIGEVFPALSSPSVCCVNQRWSIRGRNAVHSL